MYYFGGPLETPMGLPPADGCSGPRALKLCRYVRQCIPRIWGLLIWTFSKKIDSLPAVVRVCICLGWMELDRLNFVFRSYISTCRKKSFCLFVLRIGYVFFVATKRLYMSVCPSVGPLVGNAFAFWPTRSG